MGESKKIFVYGAGISGIGVSEVLSDRENRSFYIMTVKKHWILAGWKNSLPREGNMYVRWIRNLT